MARSKERATQANDPRVQFTIANMTLLITEPYAEGHTLNEAEASVLNQTYRENIRNGIAAKVKESPEEAQQIVDDYTESYAFGVRRARAKLNPVDAAARKIAVEKVNEALAAKGIKKADYELYDEKVASVMVLDVVQAKAKRIVAAAEADLDIAETL